MIPLPDARESRASQHRQIRNIELRATLRIADTLVRLGVSQVSHDKEEKS